MQRLTSTPFGQQPVASAHLAAQSLADYATTSDPVDKWQIFRDLTCARQVFGLPSRSLTVLSALISFYPKTELSGDAPLIVFPSNRTLAARAHGMSEATLRRHLAALVGSGLILRHDSPNGKRYAARDSAGEFSVAFGFDLRPLLVRAIEISDAAETMRETERQLRRLRETVVLRLRDAVKMAEHLAENDGLILDENDALTLDNIRKLLRRKAKKEDLTTALLTLNALYNQLSKDLITSPETEVLEVYGAQNERHNQDSNQTIIKKETQADETDPPPDPSRHRKPDVSLQFVLEACPSLAQYSDQPITCWSKLHRCAEIIAPWLGISQAAWQSAQSKMGQITAAITVAAILEQKDRIKRPAGYLKTLSDKALCRSFTTEPMLQALVNKVAEPIHRTGCLS